MSPQNMLKISSSATKCFFYFCKIFPVGRDMLDGSFGTKVSQRWDTWDTSQNQYPFDDPYTHLHSPINFHPILKWVAP